MPRLQQALQGCKHELLLAVPIARCCFHSMFAYPETDNRDSQTSELQASYAGDRYARCCCCALHTSRPRAARIINEDTAYTKNKLSFTSQVHALYFLYTVLVLTWRQQCFAVKAGINGLLDVARKVRYCYEAESFSFRANSSQTYIEIIEDIEKLSREVRQQFRMPNLKVQFAAKRGMAHIIVAACRSRHAQDTSLPCP